MSDVHFVHIVHIVVPRHLFSENKLDDPEVIAELRALFHSLQESAITICRNIKEPKDWDKLLEASLKKSFQKILALLSSNSYGSTLAKLLGLDIRPLVDLPRDLAADLDKPEIEADKEIFDLGDENLPAR